MAQMIKQTLKQEITGGFHIWPKKSKGNSNQNEVKSEVKSVKLEELFVKIFSN